MHTQFWSNSIFCHIDSGNYSWRQWKHIWPKPPFIFTSNSSPAPQLFSTASSFQLSIFFTFPHSPFNTAISQLVCLTTPVSLTRGCGVRCCLLKLSMKGRQCVSCVSCVSHAVSSQRRRCLVVFSTRQRRVQLQRQMFHSSDGDTGVTIIFLTVCRVCQNVPRSLKESPYAGFRGERWVCPALRETFRCSLVSAVAEILTSLSFPWPWDALQHTGDQCRNREWLWWITSLHHDGAAAPAQPSKSEPSEEAQAQPSKSEPSEAAPCHLLNRNRPRPYTQLKRRSCGEKLRCWRWIRSKK